MESDCGEPLKTMSRKEALTGAGLTIGAALVVAAITVLGRGPVTESIGLVMTPGVLGLGVQWAYLRKRPARVKVALIGGTFVVLFLIGLLAGLVQTN